MWTTTKTRTSVQNAYRHFKDHGGDFGAKNALDYVKQAHQFLLNPPAGTLTRIRTNGDIVRYNPLTNVFGVLASNGLPRTFSSRTLPFMVIQRTWITSMHNNDIMMRCRVCGLLQNEPPWGKDGKSPTFDFCACCGVEFGYGDATPKAIGIWRQKWLGEGGKWDAPELTPANWDLQEQLSHVEDLLPTES